MKLDELNRIAKQKKNRMSGGRKVSSDVCITLNKSGHGDDHRTIRLVVSREPRNCKYAKAVSWLPIHVRDLNRLYLMCSDPGQGYTVQRNNPKSKGTTLGWITFTDHDLCDYIKASRLLAEGSFNAAWKWDPECSRPYISLVKED